MKWIQHDSDASLDSKLQKLRIRFGMEGYGVYWLLLELIAKDVTEKKLTFELEHDSELIAHYTGINIDQINSMMAYMIDLGLFENTGGTITCMKLLKRINTSMVSSPTFRKAITEIKSNHDPVMTPSKQKLEGRSKKIEVRGADKPSLDALIAFFEKRGVQSPSDLAESFFNHYESVGWKIGKNKMQSWPHAAGRWASEDLKRNPPEEIWE